MKHIIKPVGHCLATAVITSTLLRVYPAAIAEAASPEPTAPATSEAAPQAAADAASPEVSPDATVVPPAAPVRVESIVSPEVMEAIAPSTAQPSEAQAPSSAAADAPNASAPQTAQTDAAKPTPAKQAPAAQPQTVAILRQQIDQRLAAIVARDRASREAQLQQNLTQIALQYAQAGEYEQARQVARHPALPPELQSALLAQIDQIAAGILTPTAGQTEVAAVPPGENPRDAANPANPESPATPGAAGVGRVVPLSPIADLPSSQAWTGSFALPQCPAPESPSAQPAAQTSPAAQNQPQTPRFGNRAAANLAAAIKQAAAKKTSIAQPARPQTPATEAAKAEPPARPAVVPIAIERPLPALTTQPARLAEPAQEPINPAIAGETAQAGPAANFKAANPEVNPEVNPEANSKTADRRSIAPAQLPQIPLDALKQNSSPFEIMGYWLSKPLKQVGIRLPFLPLLSDEMQSDEMQSDEMQSNEMQAEAQTETQQAEKQAQASSGNSVGMIDAAASPSPSESWTQSTTAALERSPDLPQSALSLSPSLLDFKESLAEVKFAAKNAVKQSSPAVAQTVSVKAVAQPAAANCFSPSADVSKITISPALSRQMGWKNLVFPLSIPAVLTSGFGWRIHPISGDRRFHAGIDLGAPMGTPVVSAMAGRVVAADDMGGYGLAVIVESPEQNYRTLYAHLSGIAVRPGTTLQQGSILGWVGSTGNSTGPHLHFETLVPTAEGWMAIDPLTAAAGEIARR